MNDEQTTEPNIEKIEDQNNEANQDLSKDKVTGDIRRVFYLVKYGLSIFTSKILSNDNKKLVFQEKWFVVAF